MSVCFYSKAGLKKNCSTSVFSRFIYVLKEIFFQNCSELLLWNHFSFFITFREEREKSFMKAKDQKKISTKAKWNEAFISFKMIEGLYFMFWFLQTFLWQAISNNDLYMCQLWHNDTLSNI